MSSGSKRGGRADLRRANPSFTEDAGRAKDQISRNWGAGTAITSEGSQVHRDNVAYFQAKQNIGGLRRAATSLRRDLEKQPKNEWLRQQLEIAEGKVKSAEAILEKGMTHKIEGQ